MPRLLESGGGRSDRLRADLEAELVRRPAGHRSGRRARARSSSPSGWPRLLDAAEREAKRLKDEYVSVEHLLLALVEEGSASAAGRLLARARRHPRAFLPR